MTHLTQDFKELLVNSLADCLSSRGIECSVRNCEQRGVIDITSRFCALVVTEAHCSVCWCKDSTSICTEQIQLSETDFLERLLRAIDELADFQLPWPDYPCPRPRNG